MAAKGKGKKKPVVPVTKIRLRIPPGATVNDVLRKLEITFEEKDVEGQSFGRIGSGVCCVDAAVVSPVSTVRSPS